MRNLFCCCCSGNIPTLVISSSIPEYLIKRGKNTYIFFPPREYLSFFLNFKILILTCVPKHEPPSYLPPHNISLGHHRAPAPSMLYPASDIDWRFDSYMIVYMLECHSPKMLVIQPHVIRHRKIRNWLQTRWLIQTK